MCWVRPSRWRERGRPGKFLATDPQRRAPVYDFNTIRHGLRSIEKQQALWDHALAGLRVQPLSITYEEVLADPQSVVDRIASHLGVRPPVPIDPARVTHTMQRDGLSVDWRRRFLAEAEEEFRYLADR